MNIEVAHEFWATHRVPGDPGFSHRHPHHWELSATVEGPLTGPGWVMEFGQLRSILWGLLHNGMDMNEIAKSGTVEDIAKELYARVARSLPDGVSLAHVRLREAPGCYVYWTRDDARAAGEGT